MILCPACNFFQFFFVLLQAPFGKVYLSMNTETRYWTMKEGFLIGGGLILAGLMLQLSVGPVVWDAFAWPVNGIVMAVFLAIIAGVFLLRNKSQVFRFIGTYHAAVPALVYTVLLTVVMGLTRQQADGTWLSNMLTFWPFVLVYVYIALILGVTTLKQMMNLCLSLSTFHHPPSTLHHPPSTLHKVPSILLHFGLFLAMTCATLGNADMQRLKMMTMIGVPESRAMAQDGLVHMMPMSIELKQFIFETYDDGSPKRFASELLITPHNSSHASDLTPLTSTVDVNNPVEVEGWKIYQYSYDTQMGAKSQLSILELVRDPWLPLVYAGIYMMLAGAACMLMIRIRWKFAILLAVAFVVVFLLWPHMHSDTPMPALQSPWFAPHVIVYMFAYSFFGIVTLMAIYFLSPFSHLTPRTSHLSNLTSPLTTLDTFVYAGLALMTVGMLFGALWAKEAWGHYWSWDPKETWAAITWFAYLIYIHYRRLPKQQPRLVLWLLIVSFVLLQMCWWGINYLPSAQGASVHTYN